MSLSENYENALGGGGNNSLGMDWSGAEHSNSATSNRKDRESSNTNSHASSSRRDRDLEKKKKKDKDRDRDHRDNREDKERDRDNRDDKRKKEKRRSNEDGEVLDKSEKRHRDHSHHSRTGSRTDKSLREGEHYRNAEKHHSMSHNNSDVEYPSHNTSHNNSDVEYGSSHGNSISRRTKSLARKHHHGSLSGQKGTTSAPNIHSGMSGSHSLGERGERPDVPCGLPSLNLPPVNNLPSMKGKSSNQKAVSAKTRGYAADRKEGCR